ncbi:ParM/StbA family protein [Intestinimonas butyriciproducens]|uniref:ParM/StbA family protein n=1 Tax=Intestinimonas butyriciproducens TaxID=1297617 RepID=UPI00195E36A7|nr:ParM/StbA family protein [Intestinimonas butyriciproducens]MBM6977408.1 ParM/StbA family protein [Intestinimonas butyriciproducens]
MLISIDHGNKQIKTIHCNPFTSGLTESDVQPYGRDVLKYREKYYQISDQRIPYHRDKTEDDRFFILTLFAIAGEIEATGNYTNSIIRVQLAVGLPPAHYGAQRKAFLRYFSERGAVAFVCRGKSYSIYIEDVACFPQSYAAAVTMLDKLQNIPRALVLDIGGFTADYLQIKKGEGDLSACDSLENGVILLYNKIRSRVSSEQDILLDETEIDAILMGKNTHLGSEVVQLVEKQAQEFVDDLFSTLRERQLELKSGPIVFVGGGAILLRKQIEGSGKVPHPIFVEDICANAKGYELLYRFSRPGR